ncbi:MAG: DUF3375 domain-containing protein [Spirochaetales bacterium]|nr:DUF3375 domain-containing protein [Spirochaetales bacterium]
MTAENGPFIAGFLDLVFRENNSRSIYESELVMRLEDYIYSLTSGGAEQEFPRNAADYLDEWADNNRGWLRKFYPQGSDEPSYDLTPATEKALQWMDAIFEKQQFVGTESRLFAGFDLLRQIVYGVEQDEKKRIDNLREQKRELNEQIKAIEAGDVPMLNKREVRERFIQFSRTARELLGDFRMVEQNFRELDHNVREQIASWTGDKGELLSTIFGEHDDIEQTEQGQSFRAFWDFIMSSDSQEEFTMLLDRVFELDELEDLTDDIRLKRVHFDWINAGEQTQKMVARLSRQLRRFLDDKSYYENKRITKLLDGIDRNALGLRDDPPSDNKFMMISGFKPSFNLPMERPLFSPPLKIVLDSMIPSVGEVEIDSSALFNQTVVDKEKLKRNIDNELRAQSQISLGTLLTRCPLEEGLAELVTYFTIAEDDAHSFINEEEHESVSWSDGGGIVRTADMPKIIFQKRMTDDG